jgi:hypothetical protein
MSGKLYSLKITQAEMYDLGNIKDIPHYILYDSGSKIAVDITAEVEQAPLLSAVEPYYVIFDTSVIEKLLSGEIKPVDNSYETNFGITGFESKELQGEEYEDLRETMIRLADARKFMERITANMRENCLRLNLVQKKD